MSYAGRSLRTRNPAEHAAAWAGQEDPRMSQFTITDAELRVICDGAIAEGMNNVTMPEPVERVLDRVMARTIKRLEARAPGAYCPICGVVIP